MGCNCKVKAHISKIEKYYGNKILPSKKTNIIDIINNFFKTFFYWLITLPILPIVIIIVFIRNRFINKPISLDKFIKK